MKRILFILLAQLLLGLGVHAQTQQELRDSLSMIEGLIEKHPKAVKLYLRKAALHIDLGQWEKALDDYDDVMGMIGTPNDSTMPTYFTTLYYRGYVNQHLHRYAFARKDYESLLRVTPLDMHALMGLTLTNLADDHNTEAYDGANRLVEIYPDTAQVYDVRCEVELKLKMPEAALEDILKAISIEKTYAERKYPFAADDDIVGYELTAFDLYMDKEDKKSAQECLDYLKRNGTSMTVLYDYYKLLKPVKPHAKKYTINIKKKDRKVLSISSY